MSESASNRPKWPYAVVAALFLLLGVDIGVRFANRGAAGSTAPPAALAQPGASPSAQTAPAAPAANGTTKVIVVRVGDKGSRADGDPGSDPTPPQPDPLQEAQTRLVAQWAKGADAGPLYPQRGTEPPMPPPSGKYAGLLAAAQAARGKGDNDEALRIYEEAEGVATDPREKEDMRFQQLWLHFERHDFKDVRRIAEAIGANPARAEARTQAAEILSKLDIKGGGK